MTRKRDDLCLCGHHRSVHFKRKGYCGCGIFYVQPDDISQDIEYHECLEFRLDNLKYLEGKYEKHK